MVPIEPGTVAAPDFDAAAAGAPLRVDALTLPQGGTLGLTHCPGRCGIDGRGRHWQRDLDSDLAAVAAWGAKAVLTALTDTELARWSVSALPARLAASGLVWLQVPIADMQAPDATAVRRWHHVRAALDRALQSDGRAVIHCAAGLGRTGTLAAMVLIDRGVAPAEALQRVRAVRPGTVETASQEDFLRTYQPLSR